MTQRRYPSSMSAVFTVTRRLFPAFLLFLAAPIFGGRVVSPQPRLVLSTGANAYENASQFSCSDTIHGHLVLPEKAIGFHSLEGVWIMPSGEEKEHTTVPLEFPPPGRQTAYLWLRFDDGGGVLDGLRGGAASEESAAINGEWRVKVLWDGQPLLESKFTVKC